MAMRSIPAILRYCRLIEEHAAEDAILFNFTNPSGLVTEAIIKSGFKRRVYGICDAPSELIRELPAILGCEERDLSVECYGLNHFSWFTHFTVRGEEVTERLIASPELYQKTAMQYFSPELVRLCDNQLLNEYLYYYYYRDEALKAIQGAGETRGEQIARINQGDARGAAHRGCQNATGGRLHHLDAALPTPGKQLYAERIPAGEIPHPRTADAAPVYRRAGHRRLCRSGAGYLGSGEQHHHQADRGVDPESRHARFFYARTT